jgi:hypothetical protein
MPADARISGFVHAQTKTGSHTDASNAGAAAGFPPVLSPIEKKPSFQAGTVILP